MRSHAVSDDRETPLQQVQYLAKRIKDVGIRIHLLSRIEEMLRILRKPDVVQFSEPHALESLDRIRGIHQLRTILDMGDAGSVDPTLVVAIRNILEDIASPARSNRLSIRNQQFQVFLAAICRNAGFTPQMAEPGVHIDVEGSTIGIAAQRVSKASQLRQQIQEGADRILQSGHPAIMAFDLTGVWNPLNRYAISQHEQPVSTPLMQAKIRNLVADHRKQICSSVAGKGVLAILAHVSTLLFLPNQSWHQDSCWCWSPLTVDPCHDHLLCQLEKIVR